MNLQEELTKLKLLEFMITIDLLIPPGEITALKIVNGAGHQFCVIKCGLKDNIPV